MIKRTETLKKKDVTIRWYELDGKFLGGIHDYLKEIAGIKVHLCTNLDKFQVHHFATVKEAYIAMLKQVKDNGERNENNKSV